MATANCYAVLWISHPKRSNNFLRTILINSPTINDLQKNCHTCHTLLRFFQVGQPLFFLFFFKNKEKVKRSMASVAIDP